MEPVQNGGPDIAKLEEPNDTKIRSDKGDPNIGSVENNSFPKIHLFERGIQVLKDICENEKISEGEKLKSMERKFPTILKVIVGIFTIGIGAAIMHKIEEKYSNEDLSARKEIANELAKFGHDIKRLENGESKKIEFCGVKINVIKKDSGKFLIKGRTKIISEKNNQGNLILKLESNSIEISKESLENNIAKNISLLNKENASKFVEGSMLNMAKDIDQFKTKDAGEPEQKMNESNEAYEKRKEKKNIIKQKKNILKKKKGSKNWLIKFWNRRLIQN